MLQRRMLLPTELPLLPPAARSTLCFFYLRLTSPVDLLRAEATVRRCGATVTASYLCDAEEPPLGLLLVQLSGTADAAVLERRLAQATGVEVLFLCPDSGAEDATPQEEPTPLVLMPRTVAGGMFRAFLEALGDHAPRHLYEAGAAMGRRTALDTTLEQVRWQCALKLLEARLHLLQTYGWAEVRGLVLDLETSGEVVLSDTFEACAWDGAYQPTCHFLAGYIAGLLESVTGATWEARERECQATGDTHCRIRLVRRERAVEGPLGTQEVFASVAA